MISRLILNTDHKYMKTINTMTRQWDTHWCVVELVSSVIWQWIFVV